LNREPAADAYPGAAFDDRWRHLVFPSGHVNPRPKRRYHLIVIGAGPAGLICASGAAGLGADVALVERAAMGGDCLNVGCVPSKALLEYTRHHTGDHMFDRAYAWMRETRAVIAEHDSVERYSKLGVDVFLGNARFVDGTTVQVDNRQLSARRIVIATGAGPKIPRIPGIEEVAPYTNETIFELREAPSTLAVIGAGPVGCELAQALSRMGIRIHLLDFADRVLPGEAVSASESLRRALCAAGVKLHLGIEVSAIRRQNESIVLMTTSRELVVDGILVAAGRQANTAGLDLDAVGVALTPNGLIKVDHRLRTTAAGIYAAGDVCSSRQFTHHADAQARIVIQNALFAPTASTRKLVVPHCTYTTPEIARVGRSELELEQSAVRFDRYRVDFSDLDRGRTAGDTDSFAELLVSGKSAEILGATIVAEDAGELLAPVCIAMANGLTLNDLGRAILPYPTRSEYLRRIADTRSRSRLTSVTKSLLDLWFRFRP
jgi:pyruvate/2-oxoglutarate dehydrogenase complex dihydrolipoamide dehydrogenase (E3) component